MKQCKIPNGNDLGILIHLGTSSVFPSFLFSILNFSFFLGGLICTRV